MVDMEAPDSAEKDHDMTTVDEDTEINVRHIVQEQ